MTTIAIIGAGRGLGAAVARRFGAEGFTIALIARNQHRDCPEKDGPGVVPSVWPAGLDLSGVSATSPRAAARGG
jgi:NAD(P)-dependent dehydrogenase (short-subunit alcohol dehydrogenase family)